MAGPLSQFVGPLPSPLTLSLMPRMSLGSLGVMIHVFLAWVHRSTSSR